MPVRDALGEAVAPHHAALDGHPLSRRLMDGRFTPQLWAAYRSAWLEVLRPLDALRPDLAGARRSPVLAAEFAHVDRPRPVTSAKLYGGVIALGLTCPEAHLWVAYAGLAFGGAMQMERVPPPHGLLDFGAERPRLLHAVRALRAMGDAPAFREGAVAAFRTWCHVFDELEALR